MLAQREHDYFAETVICANCYIVALIFGNYILLDHNLEKVCIIVWKYGLEELHYKCKIFIAN